MAIKSRVGVTKRKDESVDSLLKRFSSEVYKTGILIEYMDNMYYTKPSEERAQERKEKAFQSYLHSKREE